MKITFLRLQKPQRFNHVPIYYDERKEELDAIVRKAETEMGIKQDAGTFKPKLRGMMRRKNSKTAVDITSSERLKSNVRLVVIIGVLLFIAYMLLNSSGEYINMFYSAK